LWTLASSRVSHSSVSLVGKGIPTPSKGHSTSKRLLQVPPALQEPLAFFFLVWTWVPQEQLFIFGSQLALSVWV